MKICHLLTTSFISLTLIPSNAPIFEPTYSIFVSSDLVGPFESRGKDVSVTFSYYTKTTQSYVASFFGVGLRSGNYTNTQSKAAHTCIANTTYNVTYNLPISNYLSDKGMFIYIKFYNYSSNKVLYEEEFQLFPSSHITIHPNNYKSSPYKSNVSSFYFSSSLLMTYSDSFNFGELLDYVDVDNYYKFSFGNSSFGYIGAKSFSYGEAELLIDDFNYCFPYLNKMEDGLIHIPLRIKKSFLKYLFSFKTSFYVNPQTLEISDSYKEGFLITDNFYFPVNKKELMDGYIFTLVVNDAGLDKINFKYNMKYDVSREYIGTEESGESYIKGGIRS